MLGVDGDSEGLRQLFLAFLKLSLLECALVTLPGIHDIVVVTVYDLVLGLDDARRALFLRTLLTFVLLGVEGGLLWLLFFLASFFLGLLLFVGLHLAHDVFLKLRLLLVHVHVIEQLIAHLFLHSHQLGLATMTLAVDMLHNFVVGAQFFLVLGKDAVHTV